MALKVLMLRSRQTALQKALDELRSVADGFTTRESELAASLDEVTTDEERSTVETACNDFESERDANTTEQTRISGEIAALQTQISELEVASRRVAHNQTPPAGDERNDIHMSVSRKVRAVFRGMPTAERSAMFEQEEVKNFCQRVRELRATNARSTGTDLGIPVAFMPILRDLTEQSSKLYGYVHPVPLKGKARQNISGTAPEAIWTEAVANLNEITIDFRQLEMDGYKVAAYTAVPNSDLEDDSDLQLAASVLAAMGESLGKAFDKAIVYGTGSKMPVGFITRLIAASKPAWWGANQGDFTDLHSSNVLKLNSNAKTGEAFFADLISALAVAKPNYSDGKAVWVMNRKTHIDLMTKALAFNSAAALTAGISNTMPIIGGDIVELEFMSDYDIGGGYLSLERVVERAGAVIQSSDIPLFLQDQTVFKAVARYDGKPAIGEAFVIVNYNNTAPTTTKSFTADTANTDIGTLIITCAAGTASGSTAVTVAGNTSGADLAYKVAGAPVSVKNGAEIGTGWTKMAATPADIKAASGSYVTVVEVADGKAVKVGSGIATAKA